jgi:hypothetical protein
MRDADSRLLHTRMSTSYVPGKKSRGMTKERAAKTANQQSCTVTWTR